MKYTITVNGKQFEVEIERLASRTGQCAPFAPPPRSQSGAAAVPSPAAPVTQAAPAKADTPAGEIRVTAPMPGNVLDVLVAVGQHVNAGDNLIMLEAMKMENEIVAPSNGIVKQIAVSKSATVETNALLVILSQEG